jgi:hypothetical protein
MVENDLLEVVREMALIFTRHQIRHALIGGLAVGLRSRPRATKDADFIVQIPAIAFPAVLEELAGKGFQIDVLDVLRRWPVEHFTAFWFGRVRIDWMQPVLPLYSAILDTAEVRSWLDAELHVATAEGLILSKLVAFRPQDRADIETLLIANRNRIDFKFIRQQWATVAAGEDARTAWVDEALARAV